MKPEYYNNVQRLLVSEADIPEVISFVVIDELSSMFIIQDIETKNFYRYVTSFKSNLKVRSKGIVRTAWDTHLNKSTYILRQCLGDRFIVQTKFDSIFGIEPM